MQTWIAQDLVFSNHYLRCIAVFVLTLSACNLMSGNDRPVDRGTVTFKPSAAENCVAERFRLPEGTFDWQAQRLETVTESLEVWDVTFPSPVKTPEEANNTVHGEYYRSRLPGRRPGVIVLHILGGDFALSRLFANALAQNGVNALFVKMPYYGPRRDPLSRRRMVSANPRETVEGMTQAVLDIRCGVTWLIARPEIDADNIGVFGISLGGITAALVAGAEPRIKNVCLLLAGGDVGQATWDAAELRAVRERWLAEGKTREEYFDVLRVVDPVTYAAAARGKRVLMLNATSDEVIPRRCTESLWKALGEPEIRWYSGGHYSVMRHIFGVLLRVPHFFANE
jgi:dienelactone hydrolase